MLFHVPPLQPLPVLSLKLIEGSNTNTKGLNSRYSLKQLWGDLKAFRAKLIKVGKLGGPVLQSRGLGRVLGGWVRVRIGHGGNVGHAGDGRKLGRRRASEVGGLRGLGNIDP